MSYVRDLVAGGLVGEAAADLGVEVAGDGHNFALVVFLEKLVRLVAILVSQHRAGQHKENGPMRDCKSQRLTQCAYAHTQELGVAQPLETCVRTINASIQSNNTRERTRKRLTTHAELSVALRPCCWVGVLGVEGSSERPKPVAVRT